MMHFLFLLQYTNIIYVYAYTGLNYYVAKSKIIRLRLNHKTSAVTLYILIMFW